MPDVIPMLAYEDGVAALEWLVAAFGFQERERWLGPKGELILSEPEDGGPGRRYRAEDLEGHRWMFLQRSA
jgi:uncharacterized glyoxalase superfamily protein PhnB